MEQDDTNNISKVQNIVKSKVKLKKIKFKGKTIISEKTMKEWNIPKIINTDIGFQLMFGFNSPNNPKPTQSNLKARDLNYARYSRH
tara:strand:+ start:566 stop:823 length:258 start_codon:yes stop_codon:yes gene_type:complete